MKNTWSLILAAGVIVAILFVVSLSGKKAPHIPFDERHRVLATQESCISCHAPGRQAPLKDTHPPKEQCFVCHKSNKS